jgi:uncharacterized protein (DUF488 family)
MDAPSIYTIGHGGRRIEAFLETLRQHDIAYVIDVRSKPYSRYQPDFSQSALQHHLQTAGVRYVFMGDTLGGRPDDPACYSDGKVDYVKVRGMPFYAEGIERLKKAYSQGLRVTLLCSEGRPENCHRSHLISQTLVDDGIPVTHIDQTDQSLSQDEVLARTHSSQMTMPWLDGLRTTSRKSYEPDPNPDDAA